MFLFFFILIISHVITVYSDLGEERKYINDLNEDAKKEFIDRVVRRLSDEVDLKNVSTEEVRKIPEDQLNKHSDFVKKIINEEKVNFEKGIQSKEVSTEPRRLSNQSFIDLTIQEQTRKNRHENIDRNDNMETTVVNTVVNEVTIPVQIIYDGDPNKGFGISVNNSANEGKDDIKVKGQKLMSRRSAQKEENLEPETDSNSNNSTNLDNPIDVAEKTLPSDKLRERNEDKSVTEASEERKPTVASLVNNTENIKEDEKSSIKPKQTEVETTTADNGELSDQNKVLRDSKQDSKNSSEDFLKDEDQNVDTTFTTAKKEKLPNTTEKQALKVNFSRTVQPDAKHKDYELNTHLTTISESELETTTSIVLKSVDNSNKTVKNVIRNKINDLTLTYNPYQTQHVGKNKTSKLRSKKVKIVKVGPPSKNIFRSSLPPIKITNIIDRTDPMLVADDVRTLQIAADIVQALRMGIKKETKDKTLELRTKPNLKQKQVEIYGLRSFVEGKSLEQDERNREEPYYAPIYNFDPNNAYYNAYNKFGPNYEESKDDKADEPQKTLEGEDSPNLTSKPYARSFFKKPLKISSKVLKRTPKLKKISIDRLLPFIVKKPYQLPQHDYEEYLGDDFMDKKDSRAGSKIKEVDGLKDYLRNIRKKVYLREEGKQDKEDLIDVQNKKETGWIDEGVKYYFNNLKNIAKPVESPKSFQSINYDYIGDIRANRSIKKLKSRYDAIVPTATPHPRNSSKEIITRITKGKNRGNSRELVEKFQKVYPLLKNLVQIVDDNVDEEVEACIQVMRDMIKRDDEGLEQYDWLESTVNIQSAIGKLLDLTRAATEGLRMHPSDIELLKFSTYMFTVSFKELQSEVQSRPSARARSPKSRTAKGHYVNHKHLLKESETWLYRVPCPASRYNFEYGVFRRFLNDLSDSLFDLHDALKHVSLVTNFRSQRWYGDLKDLYLHDPDRKKLLQVILHLGTTRLFNLIEDTSKNGVDEDFRRYILENQTMVSIVKDAYVFVLKVLQAAVYSR